MRRLLATLPLLTLAALAACSGGDPAPATPGPVPAPSVPSYQDPMAMATKVGATDCGKVDEAATLTDAHYVICTLNGAEVEFITAGSASAAAAQVKVQEALSWRAEQHGMWVVAAAEQSTIDAAVSALNA